MTITTNAPRALSTALDDAHAITAAVDGRVPMLTTETDLDQPATAVARAELIATAHGLYEMRIGGAPATTSVLAPGWTTYEKRLQVQRFDVTEQVRATNTEDAGANRLTLEARLADGWWRGDLGFRGGACYGDDLAFLAAVEIEFEDGTRQRVVTGPSWSAQASTITSANIYHGQHEDRRLEPGAPQPVRVVEIDRATLIEQASPLITRHEALRPEKIWTSPSGKTLLDFGQNLVGWLRFTVTGPARHRPSPCAMRRCSSARSSAPVRCAPRRPPIHSPCPATPAARPSSRSSPSTASGTPRSPAGPASSTAEDIEAVVVGSDIRRTGWFESSHAGVNQLISNSIWSQRGNFLAVPTDCPQRDERLGWTGDIAAYAATAAYQFDVDDFLHNWLLDLAEEARLNPRGFVPFVVPDLIKLGPEEDASTAQPEGWGTPTAIWGDAAVWVAEALWNAYGDLDRLRAQYPRDGAAPGVRRAGPVPQRPVGPGLPVRRLARPRRPAGGRGRCEGGQGRRRHRVPDPLGPLHRRRPRA